MFSPSEIWALFVSVSQNGGKKKGKLQDIEEKNRNNQDIVLATKLLGKLQAPLGADGKEVTAIVAENTAHAILVFVF